MHKLALVESREEGAMTGPGPRMRWWGWGVDGNDLPISPGAEHMLREELGVSDQASPPPQMDDLALPEAKLADSVRDALVQIVGAQNVRESRVERISHAVGRSYPNLLALRSGRLEAAHDAIVYPGSADEIATVLKVCGEHGVAVVPFGGGTSVVGGVDALSGPQIALDLTRMNRLISADRKSLTARFEPGLTGPEVEQALADHGLTLGHYPQSWEFSTIGGWIATRSAGQASTGYGRIEDAVLGLECVTPAGTIKALTTPASAAGPDLRELLIGSEGALGVITEVTVRVRKKPDTLRYEGWSFADFASGVEAFRHMTQSGDAPVIARLSDENETRLSLALGSTGAVTERIGKAYLKARGHRSGCLVIVGWEGTADNVRHRRIHTRARLSDGGGFRLGGKVGESWVKNRFRTPYLRDQLIARGMMVDTLETATIWSNLPTLYRAVNDALERSIAESGSKPLVMCHVSHLYASGASLYFTFVARQQPGREFEQWQKIKTAASGAIVEAGGTISHHHGVGRDHARWAHQEIGPLGTQTLRATKQQLDPGGIMNPGKLIYDGD